MKHLKTVLLFLLCILLLCGCQPAAPAQNDPTPDPDPDPVVLTEPKFRAAVIDKADDLLTVIPLQGEAEHAGSNTLITLSIAALDAPFITLGDTVEIAYDGQIMETYPAQIRASEVAKITAPVDVPFEGEWLNKDNSEYYAEASSSDLIITAIYADCFFAQSVVALPYVYKINGAVGEDWCVGDKVLVRYRDMYFSSAAMSYNSPRAEMELISIEVSTYEPDPFTCAKPVIYLYPEEDTAVDVTLTLDGELTCTYPAYQSGWHVTASPDGTLTDASGQTYNYLYWEGDTNAAFDRTSGFCIKGEDTAAFLESALADLGLTRREANEFIVYWLPLMQENLYNIIAFQTDAYTDAAKLHISPAPDTLIRVFMTFSASDTYVDLPPQTLTAPARIGFTAVEWGGTEV